MNMFKKLLSLGALMMACQITTEAYGVKGRILEEEASGISTSLWSGTPIPAKEIKESLRFIDESDMQDSKYTQNINFNSSYKNIVTKIKDKKLLNFAETCRKIYEDNESDLATKIGVHLLLERVTDKYTKSLSKFEKIQKLRSHQEDEVSNDDGLEESVFKAFINADKDITIKQ